MLVPFATPLDSRRTRLKLLHSRIADLEQRLQMAAPIPVFRIRTCIHPECGPRKPKNLPEDALVIVMGCKHEMPLTENAMASNSNPPSGRSTPISGAPESEAAGNQIAGPPMDMAPRHRSDEVPTALGRNLGGGIRQLQG